jgi:hypothetical protein
MSRWAPLEPNEVALQKLLAKVYKCAILDKASTAKFSLPDLIHNFEFHVYWWSLTPILTINILPKTKVKQHHKCHYMFIIHLVPLVLEKIICMQEFSQKWTNKVHKRQVDMAGGQGPLGGVSRCHMALPNNPLGLLYHWSTWCARWQPQESSPPLIQCQFDLRVEVELPWIHGPIAIHLEASTDLLTALPAKVTDLPAMQLPLGAIKRRWWKGGGMDSRSTPPRSVDAPYLSTASLAAYKYPLPSTHYKRGSGVRWR